MDEITKVKAVVARGKQLFFERHPHLLLEVDAITDEDAKSRGTSLDELKEVAKYRAIAGAAKALKKDSLLMLMELGTNSQAELDELIETQNTHIKKTIGIA